MPMKSSSSVAAVVSGAYSLLQLSIVIENVEENEGILCEIEVYDASVSPYRHIRGE